MSTFNQDLLHHVIKTTAREGLTKFDLDAIQAKYMEEVNLELESFDITLLTNIVTEYKAPHLEMQLLTQGIQTLLAKLSKGVLTEVVKAGDSIDVAHVTENCNAILNDAEALSAITQKLIAEFSTYQPTPVVPVTESKDDNVQLDVRFEVTGSREEAEACIAEIMECAAGEGVHGEVVDFRPVNVVTTNLENEALVEPAEAGYTAPQQVPDSITVRTHTHVEETVISAPSSAQITDPAVLAGSAVRTNIE